MDICSAAVRVIDGRRHRYRFDQLMPSQSLKIYQAGKDRTPPLHNAASAGHPRLRKVARPPKGAAPQARSPVMAPVANGILSWLPAE